MQKLSLRYITLAALSLSCLLADSAFASNKKTEQCTPKNNEAKVLLAPSLLAKPYYKDGEYIGLSWSLIIKSTIKNKDGIFKSGHLVSPRGGVQPETVYIIPSEWDCGMY